jgi:hypothetical protein
MPSSWGRLGATAVSDDVEGRIGTVVSGLCPGGSAGATCAHGAQLTFLAYSGDEGRVLPSLDDFEKQLDAKLAREFRGFDKGEAVQRSSADGTRYLDYAFRYRSTGGAVREQRFAAFRDHDGSGVVAIASGERLAHYTKAIDEFLASASSAR